jgi:hypothetical protein
MVHWRTLFFAVNFTLSAGTVAACVGALAEVFGGGGSPGSFIGGACFVGPAAAFALAEWVLYFRNVRGLEVPLGIFAGMGGALSLVALVSTIVEATVTGGSAPIGFWLVFVPVCLSLAGYGFWCAWLRVRRRTLPEERGFPVSESGCASCRDEPVKRASDRDSVAVDVNDFDQRGTNSVAA